MTYSVAMIGLGAIGMGYDYSLPESEYCLTHARAFTTNSAFKLLGATDPKEENRTAFERRYKAPCVSTLGDLLALGPVDIVVIACPTDQHLPVVRAVVAGCNPKAILCEKPLAYDGISAAKLAEICKQNAISLFVNFIRRADPAVMEIKARLESGEINGPYKAIVWYSKGLAHNGSHFLDLMSYWFGAPIGFNIISPGRVVNEYDAEPDFQVTLKSGTAVFLAAKEEHFSHYTIEVVAANGRLRYEQGGKIFWQPADDHPVLKDYRQLQGAEPIADDMNRYQMHVVEQLEHVLNGKVHTLCDGASALSNVQFIESLLRVCSQIRN